MDVVLCGGLPLWREQGVVGRVQGSRMEQRQEIVNVLEGSTTGMCVGVCAQNATQ